MVYLVLPLLPKHSRKLVKIVAKSDLFDHLDKSQVPVRNGGSLETQPMYECDLNECVSLDEFANKHQISATNVDKIREKFDQILTSNKT